MIEVLTNYGLFLIKTVTIVAAILFLVSGILSLLMKSRSLKRDQIQITNLNEKYANLKKTLQKEIIPKAVLKGQLKSEKRLQKRNKKKQGRSQRARLFILDFEGDLRASAVSALKEEITALLTIADNQDQVLLRLESAGGMVHTYGLAASQLMRIKKRGLPLAVAVDKIAASGGYLMASVADKIISAPFAIIGSIGVIAQIPNFNRLLKKHEIDYEQITAGEFKRTLTMFGENTDADRRKLKDELEETHELFKEFVSQGRSNLDMEKIATGEHWYGSKALSLNLIDDVITSDDYLLSMSEHLDLYAIKYEIRKTLSDKLAIGVQEAYSRFFNR